jgi:hypothetical protein
VLKAWSGYWIRAFVNCELEIDPNTSYNGAEASSSATSGVLTLKSIQPKTMTRGITAATAAGNAGDDMMAPPPAPEQ